MYFTASPGAALKEKLAHSESSGFRDRSHVLMNYLFPMVFFALMGGLMAKVNPSFGITMIPALSFFALMCSFFLSYPSSIPPPPRNCDAAGLPWGYS